MKHQLFFTMYHMTPPIWYIYVPGSMFHMDAFWNMIWHVYLGYPLLKHSLLIKGTVRYQNCWRELFLQVQIRDVLILVFIRSGYAYKKRHTRTIYLLFVPFLMIITFEFGWFEFLWFTSFLLIMFIPFQLRQKLIRIIIWITFW